MVTLFAFLCVLKPVRQRKKMFNKKHKIFLFQVLDIWFDFSQKFSSYWIRIRIRTFFSDSDPAKTFGLFRIRIHNTVYKAPSAAAKWYIQWKYHVRVLNDWDLAAYNTKFEEVKKYCSSKHPRNLVRLSFFKQINQEPNWFRIRGNKSTDPNPLTIITGTGTSMWPVVRFLTFRQTRGKYRYLFCEAEYPY
jgi:hypothetical protein